MDQNLSLQHIRQHLPVEFIVPIFETLPHGLGTSVLMCFINILPQTPLSPGEGYYIPRGSGEIRRFNSPRALHPRESGGNRRFRSLACMSAAAPPGRRVRCRRPAASIPTSPFTAPLDRFAAATSIARFTSFAAAAAAAWSAPRAEGPAGSGGSVPTLGHCRLKVRRNGHNIAT